jgi:hypothetical protein
MKIFKFRILQLIFISFLWTNIAVGQTIPNGTYCASSGFTGLCIDFSDSNTFVLRRGGCLSSSTGKGDYKIRKDSLILYFEDAFGLKTSRFEIIEESNVTDNTMIVDVQMFYGDSLLPTYAPLIITNDADEEYQKMIVGMMTDSLGKATLKLDSKYGTVRLILREVGAVPFYISLDRTKNYKIKGYLTEDNTSAIEYTTWKYKIISKKGDKLVLQNGKGDNIDTWNFGIRK